jgi:hypothetical protein
MGCSGICAEGQIFSMFEHPWAENVSARKWVETFDGCISVFSPFNFYTIVVSVAIKTNML